MNLQTAKRRIRTLLQGMGRLHFTTPFSEEEGVFSNGKYQVFLTEDGIWLESSKGLKKTLFTGEKAFSLFARSLASKISPPFSLKFKGRVYSQVILAPSEIEGKQVFIDSRKNLYFITQERTQITLGLYDLLVGEGGETAMLSLPELYPKSSPKILLSSVSLEEEKEELSSYFISSRVVTKSLSTKFTSCNRRYTSLNNKTLKSNMKEMGITLPIQTVEILDPTQSEETEMNIIPLEGSAVAVSFKSKNQNTIVESQLFTRKANLSEILSVFRSIGIEANIYGKAKIPFKFYSDVKRKIDFLGMKVIHSSSSSPFPPLEIKTEKLPLSQFFEEGDKNTLIQRVSSVVNERDPIWRIQKILEDLGFIYTFKENDEEVSFTILHYNIAGPDMVKALVERMKEMEGDGWTEKNMTTSEDDIFFSIKR